MTERLYKRHQNMRPLVLPKMTTEITPLTDYQLDRVQNVRLGLDNPVIEFKEMGRDGEKYKNGISSVPATLVFNEYGRAKPYSVLSGQTFGADEAVVELTDFANETFDLVLMNKNIAGTAISESCYINQCYVNGINITLPSGTDKVTTEVTFTAREKVWLANDNAHFIYDYHLVTAGEVAGGSYTLGSTPKVLTDGTYILRALRYDAVNSEWIELVEATDYTILTATITATLVEDDLWIMYYSAATGASFKALDDTNAMGVTGNEVVCYLDGGTAGLLRVKSAGINCSISRSDLEQQGDAHHFARPVTDYNVSISIDKYESDLTLLALFAGTTLASVKDIRISQFIDTLDFLVRIYEDETHAVLLAEMLCENVRITGQDLDATIGDVFGAGFTLVTDNWKYTQKTEGS